MSSREDDDEERASEELIGDLQKSLALRLNEKEEMKKELDTLKKNKTKNSKRIDEKADEYEKIRNKIDELNAAIIKLKTEQAANGFLLKKGLPPLGMQGSSSSHISGGSENALHAPVSIAERDFSILYDIKMIADAPSRIWADYMENSENLSWGTESDIQAYVRDVIKDAIRVLGLSKTLGCYNEFGLSEMRPDIWIIFKKNGFPIGVIEVKKPHKTKGIMTNKNVHGQIYDYMLRLRSFYGLRNVFGIVSTYKEWRIYWLEEADRRAATYLRTQCVTECTATLNLNVSLPIYDFPKPKSKAKTAKKSETSKKKNKKNKEKQEEEEEEEENEKEEFKNESAEQKQDTDDDEENENELAEIKNVQKFLNKRRCHASRIYDYNDRDLAPALVSLIYKMHCCETIPVKVFDHTRPYILFKKNGPLAWSWTMLDKKIRGLTYELPNRNTEQLILLQDMRGGAHGRVWFACSLSGFACVIKFPKTLESTCGNKLGEEAEYWERIWDVDNVRVETWAGETIMIMPYVRPMVLEDLENEDAVAAIVAAIDHIVKRGFYHPDVHKKNIGFYTHKSTKKLSAIIFDMVGVRALSHNKQGRRLDIEYMKTKDDDIFSAVQDFELQKMAYLKIS